MQKFNDILREKFIERNLLIDEGKLQQFEIYATELKDWNTRINLTAIKDDLDIIDKHFIDSLLIFCYEDIDQNANVADVGAGGGFPGIPIKIYRPDIYLSLIESIGKKARFLKHIIDILKLENVDILNERVEIIGHLVERREKYNLVVARCVAHLRILVEYCLPLIAVGGKFVAYKGQEAEEELDEAKNAIEILGGQFVKIEYDSIYPDRRSLIFIEKIKKAPEQYPRQTGKIRKKPL
ncbi:MAG: 16S rRNA (guanine(527)-N(7))-methyltransferase RsmG [Candidatus Poribacteria bacterium]